MTAGRSDGRGRGWRPPGWPDPARHGASGGASEASAIARVTTGPGRWATREPGTIELMVGRSAADTAARATVELSGPATKLARRERSFAEVSVT